MIKHISIVFLFPSLFLLIYNNFIGHQLFLPIVSVVHYLIESLN